MWSLLLACAGTTPAPTAASTGDTAPPALVEIQLVAWDPVDACWASGRWSRPAELWSDWVEYCQENNENARQRPYATGDGWCVLEWAEGFTGDCAVDDPWLQPCDAVPGCCDAPEYRGGPLCFPPKTVP